MPIKKSVRLADETVEICATFSKGDHSQINYSRSINSMAAQYLLLINDNVPVLSNNEWLAFYNIYNGYMPSDDVKQEARLLSWHLSEGYQYDASVTELIGSKENALALIERLKTMRISEQLAIIYKAHKFWDNNQ